MLIFCFRFRESTSILLSAFYAKFLIILGVALPVTNAIIGASPRKIDVSFQYVIYHFKI